jgi:dTDP-4-dehydrorhamnose 3,5-epimerase
MKIIAVQSLAIPDVQVLKFARFPDQRGYFTEPFRKSDLQNHADTKFMRGVEFVQANESFSHPGAIRGLHFQWNPFMGKFVRTLWGHMVDLVLDIRKNSPYFGKIIAYDMPATAEGAFGEWIWVPPGFAHGNFFLKSSQIEYYCSGEYSPACEACISPTSGDLDFSLCDPALKAQLDRTLADSPIVSDKDRNGLTLTQWNNDERSQNFIYGRC